MKKIILLYLMTLLWCRMDAQFVHSPPFITYPPVEYAHYDECEISGIFTIELVKDYENTTCFCRSYMTVSDPYGCLDTLMCPTSIHAPSYSIPNFIELKFKYGNNFGLIKNEYVKYMYGTKDGYGEGTWYSEHFYEAGANKIQICFNLSGTFLMMCNIPDYNAHVPTKTYLAHILEKSCWKNDFSYGPLVLHPLKIDIAYPLTPYQIKQFNLKKIPISFIIDTTKG